MTQVAAEKYGFDWRLIIALMFQESRFDPNAYSCVGAGGLMQLVLSTAKFMGISDRRDPETNIDAGIRYLNYLRDKFEESISLQDRMWFTLASYNAGYRRVKQARAFAAKMGLDKDRWFDNAELAMLSMARSYGDEGKQVGFCRCNQTVIYVREIRTRYFNYIRLLETEKVATVYRQSKKQGVLGSINELSD